MTKKTVYKVKPLTEGKKNILSALIEDYYIENSKGYTNRPKRFARMNHQEYDGNRNRFSFRIWNNAHCKRKIGNQYPDFMKSWEVNWIVLSPISKFSKEVRNLIYTTNTIEILNSTYKKLNVQKIVLPSDNALLKALYLAYSTNP